MNFHSLYDQGFVRVAAVSLPVHPARPDLNATEILDALRRCHDEGTGVVVLPELALSGYAIDDLLGQDVLLDATERALATLVEASRDLLPLVWVGAPLRVGTGLFNCAVAIHRGRVLGVTPKLHLPTYREFYERRQFTTPTAATPTTVDVSAWAPASGENGLVPFGTLVLEASDVPGLVVSAEVCEDMWVPNPPSTTAALHGATVIANLSASPITVARADDRELLVRSTSARLTCAYVYCAAGTGESSTDLSWDGQTLVHEAGEELARGERFPSGTTITLADVDLDRLTQERRRTGTFQDNAASAPTAPARVTFTLEPPRGDLGLRRRVDRFPFVPDDPARLEQDCWEAYHIQVSALVERLRAIGNPKLVIGVSGGLDSTHALIVAARAMDLLERPRTDILAWTLPGFATSEHTRNNAWELARSLGVTMEEVDIRPAARQMLADMGHPFGRGEEVYDVTFENVQAGLRTDYLFRFANHHGAIVLGTGDLSELALGWCTYGVGDQMSHYGINAGVPKTMIQHLIRWVAASGQFPDEVAGVLESILDTEISPELVPVAEGEVPQSTQAAVGPYELQDFTLFHVLRRGARPSRIAFLAEKAWGDASVGDWPAGHPEDERHEYTLAEIVRWEKLFLRRFFANQFKRTAIPNGPKVMAGGSLSPRGDWRMPADVSGAVWIAELDSATEATLADTSEGR